jgi:hypothetical protein
MDLDSFIYAGSASRAQEWDFDFPPTLVAKYLELWIVHAKGYYLQRRLLLQGGYPSYEYAIVPPIRTAGPSCSVYDEYAIIDLSM